MPALFPKNRLQKTVGQMKIGEVGFINPLGMWVRTDLTCRIYESFAVYNSPIGDAKFKIERIQDGYIAYIHEIDFRWLAMENYGPLSLEEEMPFGDVVSFRKIDYDNMSELELEDEKLRADEEQNYELSAKLRDLIFVRFTRFKNN